MVQHKLLVTPLTHERFELFGDVIGVSNAIEAYTTNDSYVNRYRDLAHVEIGGSGGCPKD